MGEDGVERSRAKYLSKNSRSVHAHRRKPRARVSSHFPGLTRTAILLEPVVTYCEHIASVTFTFLHVHTTPLPFSNWKDNMLVLAESLLAQYAGGLADITEILEYLFIRRDGFKDTERSRWITVSILCDEQALANVSLQRKPLDATYNARSIHD